jgi:hypothetical protein
MMLNPPYVELGVLLRAVAGAEHLARVGAAGRGYQLLAGHLCQAREAARAGCPWAREFVSAYGLALGEYVRSLSTTCPPARRRRSHASR